MIEYLALGLAWLLLPIPFAVFIGKCISVGQAGETARHAAAAAKSETASALLAPGAVSGEDQSKAAAAEMPALPAQRQPARPVRNIS